MKIGVIVPQGWVGEFAGWEARRAWERAAVLARQAETLGFESLWVFDHFQTTPVPTNGLTFESFTTLTALASITTRVRIGHMVICAGYRNPALTAKMVSTLDVVSGGRAELGIGAGWDKGEWDAYGYTYPETKARLAGLSDQLEVLTRMLGPGRASFDGDYWSVRDAINMPKGLQAPRIPIMVGGNGPEVTWRLAARHADELNLDWSLPDRVAAALPVISSRCEEIGRDPASLRVSVHFPWELADQAGPARVATLSAYRSLGVHRVMALLPSAVSSDAALEAFAEDARAAGADIETTASPT